MSVLIFPAKLLGGIIFSFLHLIDRNEIKRIIEIIFFISTNFNVHSTNFNLSCEGAYSNKIVNINSILYFMSYLFYAY